MRTTVDIPDSLFLTAKRLALDLGLSLKQLVTIALEKEVSGYQTVASQRRISQPLVRLAADSPLARLTPDELAEIDAATEVRGLSQ